MTKANIIKLLQQKEAELYLNCIQCDSVFGKEHRASEKATSRWATVFQILEQIGVESDRTLPDSIEAFRLQS